MTVYWVVWDAAAAWVVERLMSEGALPALRRLRSRGTRAAARPPQPNCQTPPSLATLFTGTPAHMHGVTGFDVPAGPAAPVLAQRSGFARDLLAQPPVWSTIAAHGRRSALVHAPWVFDDSGVGAYVDAAIEAYSRRVAPQEAIALSPGERRRWDAGPHQVRASATGGSACLSTANGDFRIADGGGWMPVRLGAGAGFWASCHGSERGTTVARTGVWHARAAGRVERLVERLRDGPVFAGEGAGSLYRREVFGPRLTEGGDGTSERVFLDSVRCVARSFAAAADAVLTGCGADLVVIYLPMTDEVGHELVGWCDERSGAYRPDIAGAVWLHVRRCYRWADGVLGQVLECATPADTVVLAADHGVVGSTHAVALNEQLAGAGLVVRAGGGDADPGDQAASGTPAPSRSRVVYHPANNGALVVNHDGLPGGVVPAGEVEATLRRAFDELAAITDPAGGGRVVRRFVDRQGRPVDPATADGLAYVVLADDFQPVPVLDGGPVIRPLRKSGAHVVNTGSSRLHATFAAAGPGIVAGADAGVIDNTVAARLVLHELAGGDFPAELRLAGAHGKAAGW